MLCIPMNWQMNWIKIDLIQESFYYCSCHWLILWYSSKTWHKQQIYLLNLFIFDCLYNRLHWIFHQLSLIIMTYHISSCNSLRLALIPCFSKATKYLKEKSYDSFHLNSNDFFYLKICQWYWPYLLFLHCLNQFLFRSYFWSFDPI